MAINAKAINSQALNAEGQTAHFSSEAYSEFSISSTQARISVIHFAEGQATLDISQTATAVRILRPLAASYLDVSAENLSLLHTHGFRGTGEYGFKSLQIIGDHLMNAGDQFAETRFVTVKATPIEEVSLVFTGFTAEVDSIRTQRARAFSALDVSTEDSTTPDIYRHFFADSKIRLRSDAEPGVNKEHQATAQGEFGFSAVDSEVLVRNNSLGDADIRVLADVVDAKVNMRHAGRVQSSFGLNSVADFNVNSMMEASSAFRVSTNSPVWTRIRTVHSSRGVGFDSRKAEASVLRGMEIFPVFGFFSNLAAPAAWQGFRASATVRINQQANSRRRVRPTAHSQIAVSGTVVDSRINHFTFHQMTAYSNLNLLTARAQGLSNLTQPAAQCNTFVVPEREFLFEVPFDDRRFVVPCD